VVGKIFGGMMDYFGEAVSQAMHLGGGGVVRSDAVALYVGELSDRNCHL
jgi:hypothetical protein